MKRYDWLMLLIVATAVAGCQVGDSGETGGSPPQGDVETWNDPDGGDPLEADASSAPTVSYAKVDGFRTEVEDGRLWILRDGEERSEKHVTLIGIGPHGETVKALDKGTAWAYLLHKPGFEIDYEDGRLWILREGETKSEKCVTLVGVGPRGMTVRALSKDTWYEYDASCPGFRVIAEDGRLWILREGEEKSEKHVTRVGAGPGGTTLKALDRETLDAYLAAMNL